MANKRSAGVYYNGLLAGILSRDGGHYSFEYDRAYREAGGNRAVSVTLPLQATVYQSEFLFPAFINMLSEGANKSIQCRLLKIDENDYFSLLLATASGDSIGPITIKEINVTT